jgi:hypothetical protein
MFIIRLTAIATLALGLATTTITTAIAAPPMTTTPGDRVLVTAHQGHHHELEFIGPKGGDTRKGVYAVPARLTGAVVSLTYPNDRGRFIGPKGGSTRKGIPLVGVQPTGAVIPLVYHDTNGLIGPKGGEVRKGILGVYRGGARIPLTY